MLMIHLPPASSCSPFHVPQVFLLLFPSSSAAAAFPQVWYLLLFSVPTPATAEASLYSLLGIQNLCRNSSSAAAAAAAPPPPQSTVVVGW
jgi:hypothetical protein